MKVMISIKPEFADKIFNGNKKYEFRKVVFTRNDIVAVVVYASSPIRKVIGEFKVKRIISASPYSVWHQTKIYAGISKEYFDNYFIHRHVVHAIHIGDTKKYRTPKDLSVFGIKYPPQSFMYIREGSSETTDRD